MGEQIVEVARAFADQMGEDLAFLLAAQIGARRGRGQVELRGIAGMLGHLKAWPPFRSHFEAPYSIARRALSVKGVYRAPLKLWRG